MRVLHIDTFARLSAKATHERQTFLRELRNLKKVPTITWHNHFQVITCFLTISYDKIYIIIIFNTKERDKNEKTSKSI